MAEGSFGVGETVDVGEGRVGPRPSRKRVALASARRQGPSRLVRFAPAVWVLWRNARARGEEAVLCRGIGEGC